MPKNSPPSSTSLLAIASQPITYNDLHGYLKQYNSTQHSLPPQLQNLTLLRPHLPIGERPSSFQTQEAINKTIRSCLELLEERNAEYGRLIFRRFVAHKPLSLRELAKTNRPDAAVKEENRLAQVQKKAITGLAEIMSGEEAKAQAEAKADMLHRLGASGYHTLIGTETLEQNLVNSLLRGDSCDIFVLTGHGGIGKSSMADRMVRLALEQHLFYDVIHIDVINGVIKPGFFCKRLNFKLFNRPLDPAETLEQVELRVAKTLTTLPFLVLVDGVEDQLEPVLSKIRQFCGPTKFIVTSREKPADHDRLDCQEIPPLSVDHGRQLFAQTLQAVHNRPEGFDFSVAQFDPIFDKVGGNPLALKLVATLTQQMTLPAILEDLNLVEHSRIRALYDRVYKRIWGMLDQKSRQVMISLALFNKNTVTQQMVLDMNRLDRAGPGLVAITPSDLKSCLAQLSDQSLIEVSGSFLDETYRYGLHNLTHSFLRTSIIEWPAGFEIAERYGRVTPLPQIQQGLADWLKRADRLTSGNWPEAEVLQDLNSISEVIDLALYWPQTRRDAVGLLQKVWSLLQRHGYFETLEPQLEKAIGFLEQGEAEPSAVIRLKNRLGQIWRINGDAHRALTLHSRLRKQVAGLNDNQLAGETEFQMGEDFYALRNFQDALAHAEAGLNLFLKLDNNMRWVAAAENTVGLVYRELNRFKEAATHFENAVLASEKTEDSEEQARYLRNFAYAISQNGMLEKALEINLKALGLVESNQAIKNEILHDLGRLELIRSNFWDALGFMLRADENVFARTNKSLFASLLHNEGYAYSALNQWENCITPLEKAVEFRRQRGEEKRSAKSMGLLAEAHWRCGNVEAAIPLYETAINILSNDPNEEDLVSALRSEKSQMMGEGHFENR